MANSLTALTPILFSAAADVANEPFGAVDAVNVNFDSRGVAVGDVVKVPVAPARSASDYTPAMSASAGDDATAEAVSVTITRNRQVSWHLNGEQIRSLQNADSDREWVRQLIAQGMRTLRNEAEADLCSVIYKGASRAVGTAGTAPFGSNLDALVDARKVLRDNGAPLADAQFIMDTSASSNLLKLGVLQNAYQAGSDAERRAGRFLPQFGFTLRESAGVASHTKGTAAGATTNASGYSVGATTLTLASAGTGTILAGDVITLATENAGINYVVNSGDSDVSNGGTITLGKPGLRKSIAAATRAITVGNSYTAHLAFERQAVVAVMRPPLIPDNPIIQQRTISDERGMTYLLVQIAGDGMLTWRLHLAWGFAVVNPEFVAVVMG